MLEVYDLEKTAQIYFSEDGRMSRDLISYYAFETIKGEIRGKTLLMGLGDGYMAKKILTLEAVEKLTIIEGASLLIKRHMNDLPDCEIVHGFFEEFEPEEKFDTVVGTYILEHVLKPHNILKKAKTWMMKPKSKAIFTVPNASSLHRRVGVKLGMLECCHQKSETDILIGHERVYNEHQFKWELRAAGFMVDRMQGFNLKLLSNKQIADWKRKLLDAIYNVSLELPNEYCSSLAAICHPIFLKEGSHE